MGIDRGLDLACCRKCGRPFSSGNDNVGDMTCDGCSSSPQLAGVWFKVEIDAADIGWVRALDKGKPSRHDSEEQARAFIITSGLGSLAPCRVVRVTEEVVHAGS